MTHSAEQQRIALLERRRSQINRIREAIRVYDQGGMSEGRTLSLIEEIAAGEHERVVHVGNAHRPEIET